MCKNNFNKKSITSNNYINKDFTEVNIQVALTNVNYNFDACVYCRLTK